MEICMRCGTMISPHPLHKTKSGLCADCMRDLGVNVPDDPVNDGPRPKLKGKHMVVQKSQAQLLMEKRQRELGKRYY